MGTTTFHDFVEHYLDEEKDWHIPPFKRNLFAQLYRKDGTLIPRMENILRTEHLQEDFIRWCDRSGIPYREVTVGESNTNPVEDTHKNKYTLRQVHLLEQVWDEQLRTFNYHYRD